MTTEKFLGSIKNIDGAEFKKQKDWLSQFLGQEEAEGLFGILDLITDYLVDGFGFNESNYCNVEETVTISLGEIFERATAGRQSYNTARLSRPRPQVHPQSVVYGVLIATIALIILVSIFIAPQMPENTKIKTIYIDSEDFVELETDATKALLAEEARKTQLRTRQLKQKKQFNLD